MRFNRAPVLRKTQPQPQTPPPPRQTNEQTSKQTNNQTDRQTNRQPTDQPTNQLDRQTNKQPTRQTNRQQTNQTDKAFRQTLLSTSSHLTIAQPRIDEGILTLADAARAAAMAEEAARGADLRNLHQCSLHPILPLHICIYIYIYIPVRRDYIGTHSNSLKVIF